MKKIPLFIVLLLSILFVSYANKDGITLISNEQEQFNEETKGGAASLDQMSLYYSLPESNHKVLQKGSGLPFDRQVKEANTIYEIRDVFDLNNKTVKIPENCVLLFAGGGLKNGTIVGNNTFLEGPAEAILDESLSFSETDKFYIDGIIIPKGKDISKVAQRMLDVFNVLDLPIGTYYLSSPLIVKNYYAKIRGAGKRTVITSNRKIDYVIRTVFNNEVKKPGKYYNASFIEISDLRIDGGDSKYFKNGIFIDGPSCTISNCYVTNIQSVGVKLSKWCNYLNNCIITHCDIGALISDHANAVNVCYNRIESNTVNLVVQRYSGVNICNNTLEGGANFNIVVGEGQSCKIRDNYFEGGANSVTNLLTTTEDRRLAFSVKKELNGLLWVGAIQLTEKECLTDIKYKIGSQNAPAVVVIEDNFIDIHPDNLSLPSAAPDVYFVLLGSCKVSCSIVNNSFTRYQKAVCGFLDIDNAYLANVEIINNYVAGATRTNNSLDLISDNYSKSGRNNKSRIVGKMQLDSKQ